MTTIIQVQCHSNPLVRVRNQTILHNNSPQSTRSSSRDRRHNYRPSTSSQSRIWATH